MILCLYVDNLLITGNNKGYITKFKGELMEEFEMTDHGLMIHFLGIEFHKSGEGASKEVCTCKFEMEHYNVVITPAESGLQLPKKEDEQNINPMQYRRRIGLLWYLCNTRPDLAYNARAIRKFIRKPKDLNLSVVKRIPRYIKSSIGCTILFPATDKGRSYKLLGYTDSNSCVDKDDKKSITRYIFMYGETSVSW